MKNYCAYDLSRKRYMEERHRRRVRRHAEIFEHHFFCGHYITKEGYVKKAKSKLGGGNYYANSIKKRCNRRVRHNMDIGNFNNYRRCYEYWHEIC